MSKHWSLGACGAICSRHHCRRHMKALPRPVVALTPQGRPSIAADLPCLVKHKHHDLRCPAISAQLSEADILDRLEKMCDPDTDEGEWISRFDIQESKDKLVLKDMGVVGECNAKCRTIARACESIVESADLTDLSEALYSGSKRAELTQTLCYGSRGACVKKPPAVPNVRGSLYLV